MAKNGCQKNPNFSEILRAKVVQFWCYTKLIKTINVPLNGYSSKNFFYEYSDDFWCWKLTLKTKFWHFLTAIFGHLVSLMKKSNPFLQSVQSYLQSEMFLSNSIDIMKNSAGPVDIINHTIIKCSSESFNKWTNHLNTVCILGLETPKPIIDYHTRTDALFFALN